jgi:hypothetical protein
MGTILVPKWERHELQEFISDGVKREGGRGRKNNGQMANGG